MKVSYASITDPGRARPANEDSVLGVGPVDGYHLFAVADGVGGLEAGATASDTVVSELHRAFSEGLASKSPPDLLVGAILEANARVFGRTDGERKVRSGSTVVALLLGPDGFVIASVGDSRAYLLRGGELLRLTEDHSLVAEQVRAGILSEEQAARSARRNIITRSVGTGDELEVDTMDLAEVQSGDVFLLCSDGLHGVLAADELREAIARIDPPERIAQDLVDQANERGGPDNISVVLARIEE